VAEYEVGIADNENHIKELEKEKASEQEDREKLVGELQDTMSKLENEAELNKKLLMELDSKDLMHAKKCTEMEQKIEEMAIEEIKKDETIDQTMRTIDDLNDQVKAKSNSISQMQSEMTQLKQCLDNGNKVLDSHRI
jgi:chromosome segregation ATPase